MSWSSGVELLESIYSELRQYIPKQKKADKLFKLIKIFYEEYDCDSFYNDSFPDWPEYKEAYKKYKNL